MAQRDLELLQTLLALVEGDMSVSVVGAAERRIYKLWFFREGRDHLFNGRTLAEAVALALASGVQERVRGSDRNLARAVRASGSHEASRLF